MRQLNHLRESRGFTLVEVMVTVAVSGILLMIMLSFLADSFRQKVQTNQAVSCQAEALAALAALEDVFTEANSVVWTSGSVGNALAAGRGEVGNFLYDRLRGGGAQTFLLANFARESAHSVAPGQESTLVSRLLPTAIFFQAPTATTTGVLYIARASASGETLRPARSAQFFGCIVGVQFSDERLAGNNAVSSFEIRLTARTHLPGLDLPAKWCPAVDVNSGAGGCEGGRAFKDQVVRARVYLRNNRVNVSSDLGGLPGFEFPSGSYLFAPTFVR